MKRVPIPPKVRFGILKRDEFRCRYCGKTADATELHVDHVLPVIAGGTNDPSNLATSCVPCNFGKGPVPISNWCDGCQKDVSWEVEKHGEYSLCHGCIVERNSLKAKIAALANSMANCDLARACGYMMGIGVLCVDESSELLEVERQHELDGAADFWKARLPADRPEKISYAYMRQLQGTLGS